MRKRNHQIKLWMNDTELKSLDEKCKKTGQTRQSYILNAIDGAVIATEDEVSVFKELSSQMSDFMKQVRGMANNINQQARLANEIRYPVSLSVLQNQYEKIEGIRKEGETIWQSLRQLISKQNHMGQ